MQRLMFYCQHILGIGHIVRSMEIVRGLMKDFQICFINGGEIIEGFQIPDGIEVINIPAIKTDSEFKQLFVPEGFQTVDQALEHRRDLLLQAVQKFQPDVLVVELFPFGRRRFSSELILSSKAPVPLAVKSFAASAILLSPNRIAPATRTKSVA
jgi:predicted glycosyltransferase